MAESEKTSKYKTSQTSDEVVSSTLKQQSTKEEAVNPTLQKWADLIYNNLDLEAEQSPTTTISRFGIKNPKDVVTFLRSPAGDSLMAKIGTQMAIEKSFQEYQQLQIRERQLLMHRIRAAFFLWYIESQAYADEKRKEIIIGQNEKAIKDSGKTSEPITKSSAEMQKSSLMQSIRDYEKALNENEKQKEQIIVEQEVLQKQLGKLESEEHLIEFKYDVYQTQLVDFDAILDRFEQLGPHESDAEIQKHIHTIRAQMEEYLLQVDEMIRNNQDEDASILMKLHTALGLKLGSHHDMLAVRSGDKYYLDAEGNEVKSHKDALFVLEINKARQDINPPELRRARIYKDEYNNYYLLEPGQSWESIKDNTTAKAKAHKNFEDKKQDFMVVKNLIHHTKNLETEVHKERVEEVKGKIESNQKQLTLLQNQKNVVESSLAQVREMSLQLNQSNTLGVFTPVPKPTITGGPKAAPQHGKTLSAAQAYREKLEFFKQMSSVTFDALLNLAGQAPGPQKIAARNLVLSEIGNRPRNVPIPYQTMQSLLRNLERFGVDTTKPSVTSIKSETEVRKETEQAEMRSSPTPFSTDPFKTS